MQIRVTIAVLLSCVLIFFGEISAQEKPGDTKTIPGDVTFELPLKLTRLSPYLSKVAVKCTFGLRGELGRGLSNQVEIPVSAGQIDGTVRVVIAVPATPSFKPGQTLHYECALSALSSEPNAGSGWQSLGTKTMVDSLRVTPSPLPITGTFTW
jgi:hypothetical protein